jgi:exodeoxyribonuclease V alpha subunit
MAGRLVDAFGEVTFDVIDASPGRLTEVPGIGPVRSERIAAAWDEQRHVREVMAALQGHGVSTSLAVRIYKRFGDDSAAVIAREPYRLAREVWGIGFKTADTIARAVGIAPDAPERLQAGVLHALGQAGDDGHTLLPEPDLLARAAGLLAAEPGPLVDAVAALVATGELVAAARDGEEGRLFALAPFARSESGPSPPACRRWAAAAGRNAGRLGLRGRRLGGRLRLARRAAPADPGLGAGGGGPDGLVLAGLGPDRRAGTGKTHTLRAGPAAGQGQAAAVRAGRADRAGGQAHAGGDGVARRHAAPGAGAAAGRAGRAQPGPPPRGGPGGGRRGQHARRPPGQPARQGGRARGPPAPGRRPDQLPSVGAGDVLADLLRSARFPATRLTRIFRQGAGSGIAANAKRINEGQLPRFGGDVQDCFFLPAEDPAGAAQLVADLVARRLPARYGFGPGDVQVLARCTGARRGWATSTCSCRSGSTRP